MQKYDKRLSENHPLSDVKKAAVLVVWLVLGSPEPAVAEIAR